MVFGRQKNDHAPTNFRNWARRRPIQGQTREISSVPTENCHDKLFKSSLADRRDAAMELRAVLPPALASQIDFETLKPMPGSFVDEAMRGSQTDLLYSVKCAGRPALLYVLMEHKSDVDKWTPLQMLRYMVRIWEQCLNQKDPPAALPPIIPVIVHHSETGWAAPTRFQDLFEPTLMLDADLRRLTPDFEVLLDDISFASDDALRARGMGPAATLGFLFLRDGRRGGRILDELLVWADLFRLLAATEAGRRALYRLFRYLSMVAPNIEPKKFIERVQQALPERNDVVSTLAEQWMEQGKQRGTALLLRTVTSICVARFSCPRGQCSACTRRRRPSPLRTTRPSSSTGWPMTSASSPG